MYGGLKLLVYGGLKLFVHALSSSCKLRVYAALSYTSVCGLKLLVYGGLKLLVYGGLKLFVPALSSSCDAVGWLRPRISAALTEAGEV